MSDFLEKNLEDLIFENKASVVGRGFPALHPTLCRQFRLPSGKCIDLLSFSVEENVLYASVFELKREKLTIQSLLQLLGYGSEFLFSASPHFLRVEMDMVLVGNDYDQQLGLMLTQMLPVEVYLYKYTYDGLFFKRSQSMSELASWNKEVQSELLSPCEESTKLYNSLLEAASGSQINALNA
jgi:hypothetical protein